MIPPGAASAVPDAGESSRTGGASTPRDIVLRELQNRQRFLVVSHARPDGDAVGSVLAMGEILRHMGKSADLLLADAVPQVYRTLPEVERIHQAREVDPAGYDAVVILECDDTERTGIAGLERMFILNIDHHRTGCNYGTVNWIDPEASCVAAMVYELAQLAGVPVSAGMATCLYTALMTDTGSFTYPGTSAESFTLAHALIDLGAKADTVARDVLYSVPAARIHLLGIALSRVSMAGPLAWTYITQSDLQYYSATDEDTEGTVNYLISIAGVEAAAFLREIAGEPQRYRTSLRSKSGVDVSRAAAACGGGGHRNAAGCTLEGPFEAAVRRVLSELALEVQRVADLPVEPMISPTEYEYGLEV